MVPKCHYTLVLLRARILCRYIRKDNRQMARIRHVTVVVAGVGERREYIYNRRSPTAFYTPVPDPRITFFVHNHKPYKRSELKKIILKTVFTVYMSTVILIYYIYTNIHIYKYIHTLLQDINEKSSQTILHYCRYH